MHEEEMYPRNPDSSPVSDPEDEGLNLFGDRYVQMSDEQIVSLCHSGDSDAEEYLLNKYKNFVRSKARSYFLIGADHEDIVQEGMIGLYKSIRDFKPEKLSSFRARAYLDGKSYQEIAETLGRHVKSIDNALQRVKRKLEKYLEDNGKNR